MAQHKNTRISCLQRERYDSMGKMDVQTKKFHFRYSRASSREYVDHRKNSWH